MPLDVQVYQVGRNFFNENGEISTNSNPQIQADPRCAVAAGGGSSGGLITQVNQLAHNRRGVNVNTAFGAGPARVAVGWGLAHELAPTTTELTYNHRVNGLATSRIYNPFPAEAVCATQFGPLGRKFSYFRGFAERVPLTDVEPVTGLSLNRKYYHALDLQGKLRARAFGREAYLFYLGSFGSANPTLRAVPTDDDTYLFVQYHELDGYVALTDGFLLTGYLGIEKANGGRFTEVDETTGQPRDQLATGVGLGFDWTIATGAGLYLRHRWMDFEDRSFASRFVTPTPGRRPPLEYSRSFSSRYAPYPIGPAHARHGASRSHRRRSRQRLSPRALRRTTRGPGLRFNGLGRAYIQQSDLGGTAPRHRHHDDGDARRRRVRARPRGQRAAQPRDGGAGRAAAPQRVRRLLRHPA